MRRRWLARGLRRRAKAAVSVVAAGQAQVVVAGGQGVEFRPQQAANVAQELIGAGFADDVVDDADGGQVGGAYALAGGERRSAASRIPRCAVRSASVPCGVAVRSWPTSAQGWPPTRANARIRPPARSGTTSVAAALIKSAAPGRSGRRVRSTESQADVSASGTGVSRTVVPGARTVSAVRAGGARDSAPDSER